MDKKFSELPVATELTATDIFPIVQTATNKKISATNVFGNINVPVSINTANADQDTIISGTTDDQLLFVDASTDRIGIGTNSPAEKLDVSGGLRIDGIVRNESIVTQTSSGPVDITANTTVLNIASAANATLVDGYLGQEIEIVSSAVGPVTLTPASLAGGTNIIFDAIGDTVNLKFISGKWYIMSNYGITVA